VPCTCSVGGGSWLCPLLPVANSHTPLQQPTWSEFDELDQCKSLKLGLDQCFVAWSQRVAAAVLDAAPGVRQQPCMFVAMFNSCAPQLCRMRQQHGLLASSQQTCPQSLLPAAALPPAALAQSAQSPRHLGQSPCRVTEQSRLLTRAAGRTAGHSSPSPQEASPSNTCLHGQHTGASSDTFELVSTAVTYSQL
jgi:hypothetical protein